jgi:hypothetical protein
MTSAGSSVAVIDRTGTAHAPAPARSGAVRVLWLTNIPLPAVTARAGSGPIHGGGWMSAGLHALLVHARVQVTCAARSWPAPPAFEDGGVRYVTLEGTEPIGGWRGVANAWRAGGRPEPPVREMQALLDREAPDVVHVHGSETSNAMAALEAGERLGVPVLVSIQGPVSEYAPLFFSGFDRGEIARDLFSTEFLKGRGLLHAWRQMRSAAALERVTLARTREAAGRTDWDRDVVMRANPEARYWLVDEVLRPEFGSARWVGSPDRPPIVRIVGELDLIGTICVHLEDFDPLLLLQK